LAGEIFFIAGLFTDKEHFSAARAFAENGLGAALPKIAGFTLSGRFAKSL
jgi:hypothetical protein